MSTPEKSTTDEIAQLLVAKSGSVEELSPSEVRAVWRDWFRAFPLEMRPGRRILSATLIDRLQKVGGHSNGGQAIVAYHESKSPTWMVLTLEQQKGWRCGSVNPPAVETLTADLVVTPADFSWTFGMQCKSSDSSVFERFAYLSHAKPDKLQGCRDFLGGLVGMLCPSGIVCVRSYYENQAGPPHQCVDCGLFDLAIVCIVGLFGMAIGIQAARAKSALSAMFIGGAVPFLFLSIITVGSNFGDSRPTNDFGPFIYAIALGTVSGVISNLASRLIRIERRP